MSAEFKIPKVKLPVISENEYWKNLITKNKLKPLNKPCNDCAMTCGFYLDYAERLKKQPKEIQNQILDIWFCHKNRNRSCAGLRNYFKNKIKE